MMTGPETLEEYIRKTRGPGITMSKSTAKALAAQWRAEQKSIAKTYAFLHLTLWRFIDDEMPSDQKDRKMFDMIEAELERMEAARAADD
jgi:hypothetical protein